MRLSNNMTMRNIVFIVQKSVERWILFESWSWWGTRKSGENNNKEDKCVRIHKKHLIWLIKIFKNLVINWKKRQLSLVNTLRKCEKRKCGGKEKELKIEQNLPQSNYFAHTSIKLHSNYGSSNLITALDKDEF